jgi:hypothetical protein
MVRAFIAVAVFLIPAISCLVIAWKKWEGNISESKWRSWFVLVGLCSASLAMVPDAVFLTRYGTYGLHGGLTDPPGSIWITINRSGVLLWLVAVVAGLLGKSRARFPLALWTLILLATDYLLLNLMRD